MKYLIPFYFWRVVQARNLCRHYNYPCLTHTIALSTDEYDDPELKAQAKALNMRYVDFFIKKMLKN